MEKRLDRLEEKVDLVIEKLGKTNEILAINTEQLTIHIKRTALLENRVDPIETAYKEANGIIKLFTFLSMIAVIVDVAYRLIKHN